MEESGGTGKLGRDLAAGCSLVYVVGESLCQGVLSPVFSGSVIGKDICDCGRNEAVTKKR